jgi:hypothetical protein
VDAPTLDWLDGVSDLKELAGGFFPIGKRSIISKLHAATFVFLVGSVHDDPEHIIRHRALQ